MRRKSKRKNDRQHASGKRFKVALSRHHPPRELGYAELIAHLESLALKNRLNEYAYVFEQLVSFVPEEAGIYMNAFSVFYSAECWDKSLDIARVFNEEFPKLAVSYLCLARILRRFGKIEEGLALIEKAFGCDGSRAMTLGELAAYQVLRGDYSGCTASLEEARKLAPEDPSVWWTLSEIPEYTFDQPAIEQLETLASSGELPAPQRARYWFTLARIYRPEGRIAEFERLKVANGLVYSNQGWNGDVRLHRNRNTREYFDEELVKTCQPNVNEYHKGIFIAGMPRSGTTLTERILASHEAVTAFGESTAIDNALRRLFPEIDVPETYWQRLKKPDLELFLPRLAESIREQLALYGEMGEVFTEKSINNEMHAATALLAFGRGKLIHCERHPLAICLSNYRLDYAGGLTYTYDLEALARQLILHKEMMAHWKTIFPDRVLTLRYENLIANQEAETRRLLDFCGLDWDESCLRFNEQGGTVLTASSTQVRKDLYKDAVEQWKEYGDELQAASEILMPHFPEYDFSY